MAELTMKSLLDLVVAHRNTQRETVRVLAEAPEDQRPWWRVQLATADNRYRETLDRIEELPALLQVAPQLRTEWPYPSDEAIATFRADFVQRTKTPFSEIDGLTVKHAAGLLAGEKVNGTARPATLHRRDVTGAEIATLPRWAQVAFAARCVRRVERMLSEVARDAGSDELAAIDAALTLAEQSAATAVPAPGVEAAARTVLETAANVHKLPERAGLSAKNRLSRLLRGTVGSAAGTAARAVEGGWPFASDAYAMATQACYALGSTTLLDSMRRDFQFLSAVKNEGWSDTTRINPEVIAGPSLRLIGLHVRQLRAIQKLDLPADGLGWRGTVPDLMLVGGINGSGKSTLLRFIAAAVELLSCDGDGSQRMAPELVMALSEAGEAWLDIELVQFEVPRTLCRIAVGGSNFLESVATELFIGYDPQFGTSGILSQRGNELNPIRHVAKRCFAKSSFPGIMYLPSDNRSLVLFAPDYQTLGEDEEPARFVHRWSPPTNWKESLGAWLYKLRWNDLNAKEQGQLAELSRFGSYADAFRRFTDEAKSVAFEDGKLVARVPGGPSHPLSELSSGERQVLLMLGELLRHWRPGSLILIDEPELHLHTQWQASLFDAIRYWQKERGGQVIMATQSGDLVGFAEPGSLVLLGRDMP